MPEKPPPQGGGTAARVGRVLVVDDEATVRRFAARVLESDGYQVHEAGDGLEALTLLRSGPGAVDCVVSDIVMPRLNGVELLEAISVHVPGLPVILMSAFGAAQLAERGIASPCAVLAKPFAPEELLIEVRRCLASRL
ncbi:MAG TPA: response regulator [Gemmatimonadales bacterium]|nr:response regulator [Gemmatimonadales bacterium]